MNNNVKIKFINHASVVISNSNISLLTDPWYAGNVFNDGWSLLFENNNQEIIDTIENITHIWISHEHPDHFSIKFFKDFKDLIIKNKIKIVFQNTKDKRVFNYLNKNGFEVIEINNLEKYKINNNFNLTLYKSDFYDSALILEIDDKVIFNLNDCPINNRKELSFLIKHFKKCDLLLTQFSYAAWKGGKNNTLWRKNAAKSKQEALLAQSNYLNAKNTIPFASFIYFSNEKNFYLNDHVNKPDDILKLNKYTGSNICFFKPGEEQYLETLNQSKDSIYFWRKIYEDIYQRNLIINKTKFNETETIKNAKKYIEDIFKTNSYYIIYILRNLSFLKIFSPINIYIEDFDKCYTFDFIYGFNKIDNNLKIDLKIHSNFLNFIFLNNFGFDTLTVNGCFEVKEKSFSKITKTFAIGSLNAMGIKLNLILMFNFKIIFSFLIRLLKIKKFI